MGNVDEITVYDIIQVVIKRCKAIMAISIIVTVATFLINIYCLTPEFETVTSLLVISSPQFKLEPHIVTPSLDKESIVESIKLINDGKWLRSEVFSNLKKDFTDGGYTDVKSGQLKKCVQLSVIKSDSDSVLLKLSVTFPEPQMCTQIASEWLKTLNVKIKDVLWTPVIETRDRLVVEKANLQRELQLIEESKLELEKTFLPSNNLTEINQLCISLLQLTANRGIVETEMNGKLHASRFLEKELAARAGRLKLGLHEIIPTEPGLMANSFSEAQTLPYRAIVEMCKNLNCEEALAHIQACIQRIKEHENEQNKSNGGNSLLITLHLLESLLDLHVNSRKGGVIDYATAATTDLRMKITESLSEYASNQAKLEIFKKLIHEHTVQLTTLRAAYATNQSKLVVLRRAQAIKEKTFLAVSKKIDELQLLLSYRSDPIKELDRPYIPSSPVRPRKLKNTFIALVIGILFSTLIFVGYDIIASGDQ